jgi:pyridoxal phosphate enzyme (YggS family)
MPDTIATRLLIVHERLAQATLACARDPHSVTLLAVSKTFGHADVRSAARCGQRDFGENYLQEALDKQTLLTDLDLVWHFIGPIQSNKTRGIAEHFAWAHSVDRLRIAERLSAQRPESLPPLNVCLEVNISGEASKGGVMPETLPTLAAQVAALPGLKLRGLMAIPAPTRDPARQRAAFHQVRLLFDDLNARGHRLDTLSMGMSGDFESAIAEGATIVRIGTAIFGVREPEV